MSPDLVRFAYLVAASLFVLGLKGLSHPRTAVRGNRLSALGMFIAIVVTLVDQQIVRFEVIVAGIVLGGAIGAIWALKVPMTAMPQFVGLCNGFGGGASVLVAGAAYVEAALKSADAITLQFGVATMASGLIGGVTFWGSLVAFGKLQGIISEKAVRFTLDHVLKGLFLLAGLAAGVLSILQPESTHYFWIMVGIASVLGILLVVPIGGADMPVVIALLNSYSGMAAAATGFVLSNNVLIISGSLVGASGFILTSIMCRAMNRSLANVMFAGVGGDVGDGDAGPADDLYEGKVKSTTAEEVAMVLDSARRVVFVPGYGMAVAQAQHVVQELGELLEENGCEVNYAIHPVAGRMPGHMNVLLAEANVPYDQLVEMEDVNPRMANIDVAVVIGANDVVNPSARNDEASPIYGMPIINVDHARTVFVLKRSMASGFAGVDNPLFFGTNTRMLFGDAKASISAVIASLKG